MNKAFKLYNGNCLDLMRYIPDSSIDLILCDLPYGTTQNKWDTVIPFDQLWAQYTRISCGPIVLTCMQPFTSALVMSNPTWFRHELVWEKNKVSGHLNANRRPMRSHEDIIVFARNQPTYNPQKTVGHKLSNSATSKETNSPVYGKTKSSKYLAQTTRFPRSIISIPVVNNDSKYRFHPTQKPVELMEYLIKTYSNKNDIVLDNTMGSGTTGVACMNLRRKFIGMELDTKYFEIAETRIKQAYEDQKNIL